MSNALQTKPIKVVWVAPNGKTYEDTVKMTLEEYQTFVNNLAYLKRKNNI